MRGDGTHNMSSKLLYLILGYIQVRNERYMVDCPEVESKSQPQNWPMDESRVYSATRVALQ